MLHQLTVCLALGLCLSLTCRAFPADPDLPPVPLVTYVAHDEFSFKDIPCQKIEERFASIGKEIWKDDDVLFGSLTIRCLNSQTPSESVVTIDISSEAYRGEDIPSLEDFAKRNEGKPFFDKKLHFSKVVGHVASRRTTLLKAVQGGEHTIYEPIKEAKAWEYHDSAESLRKSYDEIDQMVSESSSRAFLTRLEAKFGAREKEAFRPLLNEAQMITGALQLTYLLEDGRSIDQGSGLEINRTCGPSDCFVIDE